MQEENRLTQSDDLGNWGVKGLLWKNLYVGNTITEEIYEILYGCLAKLRDYEETGFNPEEIEEFKDALAAEPEWKGKRLIDADNLNKAIEGLDQFTKNWCMNCKETEEKKCFNF